MKRPYREGSRFVVPLGDGRCAIGLVARGTRKVLDLVFFAPGPICVRASDRALRECRWPVIGSLPAFSRDAWPASEGKEILAPGIVERMLASLLAGKPFAAPRAAVLDVENGRTIFEAPATGLRVQWRRPLNDATLDSVAGLVDRRGARLRLYGEAMAQLGGLTRWNVVSLAVDGARLPRGLPVFESVRELAFDGVPADLHAALAAFPNVRTLRVRARGAPVDARDLDDLREVTGFEVDGASPLTRVRSLRGLPNLAAFEVRDSSFDAGDAFELPVRALRIVRIRGVKSIEAIRNNDRLRVLALDGLGEFDDVKNIETLALASLELRGLWQFGVDDVAFVPTMPSLQRLRLDIGGRRKNAEIYRRRLFAEPLPFDVATSF